MCKSLCHSVVNMLQLKHEPPHVELCTVIYFCSDLANFWYVSYKFFSVFFLIFVFEK